MRGRGRDELFWVLFHYMSGSLSRGPLKDFASILKLLTFYDEPEPLPVPDITEPGSVLELAPGHSRDPVSREIHDFWPFFPCSRESEVGNPGNSREIPGNWPILEFPFPGK